MKCARRAEWIRRLESDLADGILNFGGKSGALTGKFDEHSFEYSVADRIGSRPETLLGVTVDRNQVLDGSGKIVERFGHVRTPVYRTPRSGMCFELKPNVSQAYATSA